MNGRLADARELARDFHDHAGWLRGRLERVARAQAADADDLVQEAYLRFGRYDEAERRRHPRALLMRIATNLLRDEARRRHRRRERDHVAVDHALAERNHALAMPPGQIETLVLKQIVLGLPHKLRDVFLLARFTTLTQQEIAQRLGISVKTVEWRMSRALALCAAQLREDTD